MKRFLNELTQSIKDNDFNKTIKFDITETKPKYELVYLPVLTSLLVTIQVNIKVMMKTESKTLEMLVAK